MGININKLQDISIPNSFDTDFDKKPVQSSNGVNTKTEYSSANNFYALEGQMRKLQLLQKFAAGDGSNTQINLTTKFAVSAKQIIGGDDDLIKETKRIIENYRRQIKPSEIKGAQPIIGGKTSGHAHPKHGVKPEFQVEIVNKPDRIFSGINDNGRYVDIYYKNGSAVITEFGNKERVITAYGLIDIRKANPKPFNIEKIANNPRYVEVKLEKLGSTNIIYPDRTRFENNDFPNNPPQPQTSSKPGAGGAAGGKIENDPIVASPGGQKAPVNSQLPAASEPQIEPEVSPVEEPPATAAPLNKLAGNISNGIIILQLIQFGLTAYNMSQLKADGEKYGYYIDPFLDKYILTDPDKAAKNLPEGFELKFFFDPKDIYSQGESVTFTVKDGKFVNTDKVYPNYRLYIDEKGSVQAGILL